MEVNCLHCNKNLRFFNSRKKLLDGVICSNCYNDMIKYGMKDFFEKLKNTRYEEFKNTLTEKMQMCQKFETEENFCEILKIDYKNRLFVFDDIILSFKNLISVDIKLNYEHIETTKASTKTKTSGLGRALVGGILFGGTGALVGAMTGKQKSKTTMESSSSTQCSSIKVFLKLKNYYSDVMIVKIDLQSSEVDFSIYTDLEDFGNILRIKFNKILK